MNAFDPSKSAPSAPGPTTGVPRRPQPVGQPVDQRALGPDHDQVGLDLLGGGRGDGDPVSPATSWPACPGCPG